MSSKLRILIAASLLATTVAATPVQACPMCQVANEDQNNPGKDAVPRAYMYSILFMLAMPASLVTAFGVAFYRLSSKQAAINEEILAASGADDLES